MSTATLITGLALVLAAAGTAQAQVTPGDMNCDGTVDGLDIPLFVECLLHGHCDHCPPEGMVSVPGGEFEMGDPWGEGTADELPVHTVYLSPYFIDECEITNQQYADGLSWALGQGLIDNPDLHGGEVQDSTTGAVYCDTLTSSPFSRITWDGSTFAAATGKKNHPVTMVSWYGSAAYCNWRSAIEDKPLCFDIISWTCDFNVPGYRLPTEAEWEKAAAWDPDQERHFRFGEHTDGCGYDCLDGQRANYENSGDPYEVGLTTWTTPVGFYNGQLHQKADFGWPGSQTSYQTQDAPSCYGCYDMTGNGWEWCYDWYLDTYYSVSPVSNPTGPDSGTTVVQRGGGWYWGPERCRSAERIWIERDGRLTVIGFRCALGTP